VIERKIKQKLALSIFGYGVPLLIGLVTIPLLIDAMGVELFGLLTLGWALVGFAGVFDFGLGRALTKEISACISQQRAVEIWVLFRYAFRLMLLVALVIFCLFEGFMPWVVAHFLTLSTLTPTETTVALQFLLLVIPIIIVSSAFVAVLEGSGQIEKASVIRAIVGVLIFLGPVVAWQMHFGFLGVVLSLVLARVIGMIGYLLVSYQQLALWRSIGNIIAPTATKKHLLRSGGWMSVSTILAPILTTLDRFIIGAMLSVTMVAYYATPVDVLMKLQVFSTALMGVVFPAFSATYLLNVSRTVELFNKSALLIGLGSFAVACVSVIAGAWALTLWVGAAFAEQSKWVLYWTALGFFANAISYVPFALLQAIGRADITAKVNLIEMPFYFLFLFWALQTWDVVGAAIASTLRLSLNGFMLLHLTAHYYPQLRKQSLRVSSGLLLGLLLLLAYLSRMS
jgi:O-antigen/teichoic acid export membrane protein